MKILAFDTATEACSAALSINGQIEETYRLAPREHNRILLPMIESLLDAAGLRFQHLDAIAFGCGPGSFTGVRIATGVAQGLALGTGLPLVPISTLAALAYDALSHTDLSVAHTAIDARMGEVYWASYIRDESEGLKLWEEERVIPPDAIESWTGATGIATGSGWMSYGPILEAQIGHPGITILNDRFPRARAIAALATYAFQSGRTCLPEAAEPVYLRNDVAKKPGQKS
jgi:tRNA threonylcarbamoyladenosine biosynthesis protein TsaB